MAFVTMRASATIVAVMLAAIFALVIFVLYHITHFWFQFFPPCAARYFIPTSAPQTSAPFFGPYSSANFFSVSLE